MTTNPWRRILGLFIPITALVVMLAVPASAGGRGHPYFNDQGTLDWYHSLAAAQRAAREQDKLIFIEYGRQVCGNCRTLCNRVLPHAHVRARMETLAVGLVAECDRPEPQVYWLFKRNLHNARTLPFVGFITADGRWVTGFAGYASVRTFAAHVAAAERVHQRMRRRVHSPEPVARQPAVRKQPVRRTAKRPAAEPAPRVTAAPAQRAPAPAPGGGIGCPDGGCQDVCCRPNPNCCPGGECAAPECCPGGECAAPDCCPGGRCAPGGTCCAPNRLCIPGVGSIPLPGCSPCCPPQNPAPAVAQAPDGAFPAPAPRDSQAGRKLAEATPVAPPAVGIGSPDGEPTRAAPDPNLPKPFVRAAPAPAGKPAGAVTRRSLADAAAQGDWGVVVRATRGRRDAEHVELNRQAHAWAHGQLASAVRALRDGRYTDAQRAVVAVTGSMRGEPEGVDAERGAEAIELMRDIGHLPAESAVRRAVRRNAYEKMRGTRWAPLFNDCAAPSPALSAR